MQSVQLRKPGEKRRPKPRKRPRGRGLQRRKTVEYLQQLWDKVLEKKAALLERAEEFQVAGSKCKEVVTGDKKRQWPSRKARGRYCRGAAVKMEDFNSCERYVCAGQDCLVYPSR